MLKAFPPAAQPAERLYTGTPVDPLAATLSFPYRPHPLPPEKRELAAATASISLQATPASSSAASTAVRHICVSDLSANFPQGCIPRPTAATSLMPRSPSPADARGCSDRPELPGDDLVSVIVEG